MQPGQIGSAVLAGNPVHGGGTPEPGDAPPASCWAPHASSKAEPVPQNDHAQDHAQDGGGPVKGRSALPWPW